MAKNFEQGKSGLWLPKEEPGNRISPDRKGETMGEVGKSIEEIKKREAEEERKRQKYETWLKDPLRGTKVREQDERIKQEMAEEKKQEKAKVEAARPPAEEIPTERILEEAGVKADWEAHKKTQGEELTAKIERLFGDASREVSRKQEKREAKISSLADVKKVGLGRIEKLADGLVYLAAADKLGIWGMKKGKDMAVEGGRNLAAAGLSPVAALERAGGRVADTIQLEYDLSKRMRAEGMISALKELPPEKRQDLHGDLLNLLSEKSRRASEGIVQAYEKIHKKGRIARLIEKLKGVK